MKTLAYQIKRFEVDENGRHFNEKIKISCLATEERAVSWLKSFRQASIIKEADGRHVTPIENWVFNVLNSEAKGDRVAICYHIEVVEET